MARRRKIPVGFRCTGLLTVVLLGIVAIIGSNGDGSRSDDIYMRNATVINEAPPPETVSPSTPAVFDLTVASPGGAGITISVSFTDIEGDVTTFCIAFEDQPGKYYAYDVKKDAYGRTSDRLSVTDMININDIGTYCFTVFVQDEAGHTSNKLSACFAVKCEPFEEDCYYNCDDGTMTITGSLDGDAVDLAGYACVRKDDEITVGLFCGKTHIGLIIKEPDKLAPDTTYAVKPYQGDPAAPDAFPIVIERYQPDHFKETASGGTFTVITYNANGLSATYELLMPDGGSLSGEINIWHL